MLKMAVVAPVASASVSTVTLVNPGALRNARAAKRTSCRRASILNMRVRRPAAPM